MDAIILGGALNKGALRESSDQKYEAAIKIHDLPMVQYVLTALERTQSIERVIMVVPEEMASSIRGEKRMVFVSPGDSMVDSLLRALSRLNSEKHVLVLTSDILIPEALEDF